MADHRGQIASIRYGATYATVLTFRVWLDTPDAWSDPRAEGGVLRNATGSRTIGLALGHDQMFTGTVRRIPRADIADGLRTISGWPAWRAWLIAAWDFQPWRWVYDADAYNAADATTFFDAELVTPLAEELRDGPLTLERDGQRQLALVVRRIDGLAVEGY